MDHFFRRAIVATLALCLIFASFHAVFAEARESAPGDLKSSWASKVLQEWWGKEWIAGYPDDTFRPNTNISRAEFITLTNRVLGLREKAAISFRDLPSGNWAYGQIAIAFQAGYVKGYKDGTVQPNSPISRQEAAVMVNTLLRLEEGIGGAAKFNDAADFADWSKAAIDALTAEGILSGYPDGTFRPVNKITRAEAVVVLNNALQYAKKARSITYDKPDVYGTESGTPSIVGNVTVTSSGVTLQNRLIVGDLVIDGAKTDGNVILRNVIVRGKTYVNGGASQISIVDSALDSLQVCAAKGSVRIVEEGRTNIRETSWCSSSDPEAGVGGWSEPSDTTPPFFWPGYPQMVVESDTAVQVVAKANEQGRLYALAVLSGEASPSASQVKDGKDSIGAYALSFTQGLFAANMEKMLQLTGLTAGTDYDIYVVAEDDKGNLQPFPTKGSVLTNGVAPLKIVAASLPKGKIGEVYALQTISASGGVGARTFSLASGALPPGMAFTSSGIFSGSPTVAGTYTFTIRVTDSLGTNAQQTFSVAIDPPDPLAFFTTSLPMGKVGSVYAAQTIEISGGVGARTFSLASGALPPGMAFTSSGIFSGSPTVAGTYTFTIRITDSLGTNAQQSFSVAIDP